MEANAICNRTIVWAIFETNLGKNMHGKIRVRIGVGGTLLISQIKVLSIKRTMMHHKRIMKPLMGGLTPPDLMIFFAQVVEQVKLYIP